MSFILWEMPYSTGLALVHAAGVRRGVALEFVNRGPGRVEDEDVRSMREVFAEMRRKLEVEEKLEVGSWKSAVAEGQVGDDEGGVM